MPTAQLVVGGDPGNPYNIPLQTDGKAYFAENWSVTGTGWSVDVINLYMDPDPSIVYGIAVQNNTGGALSFGFQFTLPITPTPAPGQAISSMSGSTTNEDGVAGGVTVTPLAPPGGTPVDGNNGTEIQVYNLSIDGGTNLLNPGIDLGQLFNSNPALNSDSSPPENSGFVAGPAGSGSYNYMQVDLNFSLTGDTNANGNGDRYTLNGSAAVIPEPLTAALVGVGLLGLGIAGRRRRLSN